MEPRGFGQAAAGAMPAAASSRRADMDRPQAEAVASVVHQGQGDFATKADLDALRTATKADLAGLGARITWRIVGLVIAANAVLVAAVKLLP